MRSAVVLAGGYSTRFERGDKATAELAGTPLIRRVVDCIAPAVDQVVVNCRAAQRESIETALSGVDHHRLAVDAVPDRGPVAGILTGCEAVRSSRAFVTACDMPFVDAHLATQLFEAASSECAVPRIDGRLRPLAAVYRTNVVIPAAKMTLEADRGAVMDLVDRLSVDVVSEPAPARSVADVNTRAELRAARSQLHWNMGAELTTGD